MLDRLHHIGQGTIPDGFLLKEDSFYLHATQGVPFDRVRAPCVKRPCAFPHAFGDRVEGRAGKELLSQSC